MASQMHRRKSSQDDENTIVITEPSEGPSNSSLGSDSNPLPPPSRTRVNSTPAQPLATKPSSPGPPPSAGPYRASFSIPTQPGHRTSPAFRTSFSASNSLTINGHSRTRTMSTPFSPSQSSPLAFTFPQSVKQGQMNPPNMSQSISAPPEAPANPDTTPKHTRRHSRMHSRNLSIFFPRPGGLPQNTINEDGSQELEIGGPDDEESAVPIPSAGSNISVPGRRQRPLSSHGPTTPLGAGFTFGAKPPRPPGTPSPVPPPMSAGASSSSRRKGHHHKHSLSHNFFSFLEPGANPHDPTTPREELHTQPTPIPVSPWNPISPFPLSPPPSRSTSTQPISIPNGHAKHHEERLVVEAEPPESFGALGWAICQFALGGWMWVSGQQNGSLAVTGLGYWVVFHALGVAVGNVLPKWWSANGKSKIQRSYGDARIETVFMFAQSVYLMFSAVYICKETFEHVLLSAGSNDHTSGGGHEGHHHHHADETGQFGIDFPFLLILLSLTSIVISAFFYGTHGKLVELAGNRIPPIGRIIRSLYSNPRHLHHEPPPTTPLGILLSNPYVTSPLLFCVAILFVSLFVSSSNHIASDLTLAGIITIITFNLAYSACVVLGTVLLQTAPNRGLSGGKMESFLRVMREIERHPNVLHLPPPHIWQLTPTPPSPSRFETSSLVATLELHVRKDLSDEDVLSLTKWAWERCTGALGVRGDHDEGGKADVTVGIVRG